MGVTSQLQGRHALKQWFPTWKGTKAHRGCTQLWLLWGCEVTKIIFVHINEVDGRADVSKSHDQFKTDVALRRSLSGSRFWLMFWCGLQTIYQFLNCVDGPSKSGLIINNIRHAFRKHCRHICCAVDAGRSDKNGLFSQKCPQAIVFASKKKKKPPSLVGVVPKKAPHQPITKLYGKAPD